MKKTNTDPLGMKGIVCKAKQRQIDSQLQKNLETKVPPDFRAFLLTEIPRAEGLLKIVKENDPRYGDLIRPMTKMYWSMNQQVAIICKFLKYPLNQNDWNDCEPLIQLGMLFRGIEATNWYQYQLTAVIMGTDHPWYQITPYGIDNLYPSPKDSESN